MKLIDKLKMPTALPDGKSRLTYAVLATLFGGLGIHNFYAGNPEKAKAQLTIGLIGLCCCCQPLYILSIISAMIDVITVTAYSILKPGTLPMGAASVAPTTPKPKDAAAKKPFPVKLVVIAAIVLFIGLPIVGGIVITVVGVAGGLAATSAVEKAFDSDYEKWVADDQNVSGAKQLETTEQRAIIKPSKSATSTNDAKNLTPDQKTDRLMAQLRKVLGNSGLVTVALATVQEKADQCQGDYKTKCVLIEMMGLQNKIPGGVVPDLPDPNGNGALEKYLKAREIDGIGTIMCMYHVLTDEEQKSVSDEVRKLMK